SQPPDSGETLAPGSVYPFASADDLRPVLTAGTPAILGPTDSNYGRCLVAYTVIGEPADGTPVHLLAMGFAAEDWALALWGTAFGTAAYVWMFLILPLVALVSTRRQAQQRDALRNLTEAMEQGRSAVVI